MSKFNVPSWFLYALPFLVFAGIIALGFVLHHRREQHYELPSCDHYKNDRISFVPARCYAYFMKEHP